MARQSMYFKCKREDRPVPSQHHTSEKTSDLVRTSDTHESGKAERLPKQAMNWKLPGKRGRGRPRTTWSQTISRDLSDLGMSSEEAEAAALDRTKWRKKLCAFMRHSAQEDI